MTRAPALWLVAGALVVYGVYAAVRGVDAWQPDALVFGAASLAAAAGLLFERRWAAYLLHAIVALLVASWIAAVAGIVAAGWPYRDAAGVAVSLAPGIAAAALAIAASVTVFRHFRRPRAAARGETHSREVSP